MEHRLGVRRHISCDVLLRTCHGATLHGEAGDVSSDGMFVKTGPLRVEPGTPLELEISTTGERLPALAIHRNATGIGVMFMRGNGDVLLRTASAA